MNDKSQQDKTNEEELLLDHDYDGIQELDNPLPMWWLATFYITIIFAILYFGYYQFGDGLSLKEEYAKQSQENKIKLESSAKAAAPVLDEASLVALLQDANQVSNGKTVFQKNCASCHGAEGQGVIGPNLTDEYWIHGKGKISDILQTVSNGVLEKGMPAWGPVLKPEEVKQVSIYIKSLKGSNPAGAKAPQGDKVD